MKPLNNSCSRPAFSFLSAVSLGVLVFALAGCGQKTPPPEPAPAVEGSAPKIESSAPKEEPKPAAEEPKPAAPSEAAKASGPGIFGKVVLKGTPQPDKAIPMDAACSKLHPPGEPPKTRFYITGEGGALADVFVYVKEGLGDRKFDPPSEPVVLDQVGCEYVPYVVGAQTGQKIVVKNSDPVFHNVHPTPTIVGNKEYNKSQLPKGPDLEFVWDIPEVFLRFKCDVHPWMFSYVGLVNHPFHSVTDKTGQFSLKNVPPGKYVIEAYHRKAGKVTKEVTIGEGEAKALDFVIEVPAE